MLVEQVVECIRWLHKVKHHHHHHNQPPQHCCLSGWIIPLGSFSHVHRSPNHTPTGGRHLCPTSGTNVPRECTCCLGIGKVYYMWWVEGEPMNGCVSCCVGLGRCAEGCAQVPPQHGMLRVQKLVLLSRERSSATSIFHTPHSPL
jgi:hypothetical protein